MLYVGVTGHLGKRLGDHAEKSWFLDVEVITLEWYEDRKSAERAEVAAISNERPKYNVVHNGDRNYRRPRPALRPTPPPQNFGRGTHADAMRILQTAGPDGLSVVEIRRRMQATGHKYGPRDDPPVAAGRHQHRENQAHGHARICGCPVSARG